MVHVNFPKLNQPRLRLDLGGSGKVVVEKRTKEFQVDPRAKDMAKMYLKLTKALDEKIPIREELPKAIILCIHCQCELLL